MRDTELREALAALAHEQWSGWMRYQFGGMVVNADGSQTMPAEKVVRWQRQMMTPYAELPEAEKESDRAEADRVLALLASREDEEWQQLADWINLRAAAWRVIGCWGEPDQTWYSPDMEEAVAELRRLVGPLPPPEEP